MAQNRPPKSDDRESGLVQRMRISVQALPVTQPHVLLACSGGKDSVALASIFSELRRLDLLTFAIAHVHHGQHERADLAAEAVRSIGEILDVPVSVHRLDQAGIDAHAGVGLEEAMRRERYLALATVANEHGAECIALAHHQKDQAETILLHLIRGSGIDGLAGMREWEERDIPWWSDSNGEHTVAVWRPLLGDPEEALASVAEASGLPVVEDPTNLDPNYRRNAIRHQILPLLESIAEGSTAAIARSAGIIASDVDVLESLTEASLRMCEVRGDLARAGLLDLHRGMQRRVVRLWVARMRPDLDLSANRIDAVIAMAERNRGGAMVEIGGGRSVRLEGGLLKFD